MYSTLILSAVVNGETLVNENHNAATVVTVYSKCLKKSER